MNRDDWIIERAASLIKAGSPQGKAHRQAHAEARAGLAITDERVERIAERLASIYGPDPNAVGAEDGTEDDFGDLISETVVLLVGDLGLESAEEDAQVWQALQDAASSFDGVVWSYWVWTIRAALPADPHGATSDDLGPALDG